MAVGKGQVSADVMPRGKLLGPAVLNADFLGRNADNMADLSTCAPVPMKTNAEGFCTTVEVKFVP